jgi:hypothetical protein
MPGFHGGTVLPGYAPDHATVGEMVIGISVKDILVLTLIGNLHRKLG